MFSDGNAVSVRKDLNGVLLLDTALQTPVNKTDDAIKLELPLPEVKKPLNLMYDVSQGLYETAQN